MSQAKSYVGEEVQWCWPVLDCFFSGTRLHFNIVHTAEKSPCPGECTLKELGAQASGPGSLESCVSSHTYILNVHLNTSGTSLSSTLKWFSAAIKQRSHLVLAVLWFLLFCPQLARDTQWLWKNKASHEITENTLRCRVNHKTNKQTKAL